MADHANHLEEVGRMTGLLLEGALGPEDRGRLEQLLSSDAAALDYYQDYVEVHSLLHWLHGLSEQTDDGSQPGDDNSERRKMEGGTDGQHSSAPQVSNPLSCGAPLSPPSPSSSAFVGDSVHGTVGQFFSQGWPVAYLVASLVFGIGFLIGSLTPVSQPAQVVKQSPSVTEHKSAPESKTEIVGRITGLVTCRWADSSTAPAGFVGVPLGRKYVLDSGLMEISYDTGAKVILQGPVAYEVDSRNGGYISVGKLTARLEEKVASGQWPVVSKSNPQSPIPNPARSTIHDPLFTVRTPTATVTDLGTEFGVEVSEGGSTMSHVFRGSVVVRSAAGGGKPAGQELVLGENESVRVESRAGEPYGCTISRTTGKPLGFVRVLPPSRSHQGDVYAEFVRSLKPVVYYRMQPPAKEQGQSTLFDSAPGAHHGTLLHDKAFLDAPYVAGRFGKSLLFRGSVIADHVIVPDYPKALADRLTVSVWVMATMPPTNWGMIAANWGEADHLGQFHMALYRADGDLSADVAQGNGRFVELREGASHPLPLGVWQHAAFVADGSTLHLYRNGVEVATMPCAGILRQPAVASLGIGCKTDSAGTGPASDCPGYWAGRIDELAIFNDALSADVIRQLSAGDPSPKDGKEVDRASRK